MYRHPRAAVLRRLLRAEYVHVELTGVKSEPGYVICANVEVNGVPVGLWACTQAVVAGLADYPNSEPGRQAVKKYIQDLVAGRDESEIDSLTKPANIPVHLEDYRV